ncbi:hypothetical protein TCT1_16640 [Xenorhabdus sp. TCT-1]|uniref:Uncharacterized protein n=1 Tax=Xenorhabdus taiwanensis TaxID=3085177 RepID=A0ABM8JVM4_9GAMM|nr:hypothetical protein TCT1_16640 [Xenorhabdus sp. TCT-1]
MASRIKPRTRENIVIELTAASDFSKFMVFSKIDFYEMNIKDVKRLGQRNQANIVEY